MRKIERTTAFKRDFKREMRGQYGPTLDQRLAVILAPLSNNVSLPESCRDHALSGEWSGHRECHVRPDLLLVYEKPDKDTLLLERLETMPAMDAVAEVLPSKGDKKMSAIISATVTARYEKATGKTFVKVDAVGDEPHGGIRLEEFKVEPGCGRDSQLLCVEVKFEPGGGVKRWSSVETPFERSAERIVLLFRDPQQFWILTSAPVPQV